LYWWEAADSSWNSYSIKDKKTVNLTNSLDVNFVIENHDYPEPPGSYGSMGWTKDDEAFYIYDKYDIWGGEFVQTKNEVYPFPSAYSGSGIINELSSVA